MATIRNDFSKGIVADMYKWGYEAMADGMQAADPVFSKIATEVPWSSIPGAYFQGTSASGASELIERTEGEQVTIDSPSEDWTIYAAKKNRAIMIQIPYELQRDWTKSRDFVRDYIKNNIPEAVNTTKEQIVSRLLNKGGLTGGDSIFANAGGVCPTYTTDGLLYDGKPLFNISAATRTAKNGTTYYNAVSTSTFSATNLLTLHTLFTSTNAYRENGVPFNNSIDKILCVPSALAPSARQVLNASLLAGGSQNDANPLVNEYELVVNPFLTDTTSYYILRKPGIKVSFNELEYDFWKESRTKTLCASVSLDYVVWVQNWRLLAMGSGTTIAA